MRWNSRCAEAISCSADVVRAKFVRRGSAAGASHCMLLDRQLQSCRIVVRSDMDSPMRPMPLELEIVLRSLRLIRSCSVPSALAKGLDLRVDHSHMSGEGIVARKGFFFSADRTSDLLLTAIVDGVLMTCEVVRP